MNLQEADSNPLVPIILEYLRLNPNGCTLLDLVSYCDETLQALVSEDRLASAFEKNFFVMNGLYQVQDRLWQEHQLYLAISPMAIMVQPGTVKANGQAVTRDASLGSYYLDWNNLRETSAQDIEALLASFWRLLTRQTSSEKLAWALSTLEVCQPLQKQSVVAAYRAKASITHPDKGGDHQAFLAVREAYEVLMAHCSR